MRSNYTLLSKELNDRLHGVYDHLIELLGYEGSITHYSGILEYLDTSGEAYITSSSGIPSVRMNTITNMLKFDYIYRTHYNQIKYSEK